MHKFKITFMVLLLFSGLAFAQKVGTSAPDFVLVNDAGEAIGPSDYLGRPFILNSWASWCAPCVEELPFFLQIYDEVNADSEDLVLDFLLVNNNEDAVQALSFLRDELEIRLATGVDASKEQIAAFKTDNVYIDKTLDVIKRYRIRGMPTTFFIDAEGVIQPIKVGFLTPGETSQLLASIGIDWTFDTSN